VIPETAGAHCAGVGCEHDAGAVAVPRPVAAPRHRETPGRHQRVAAAPSNRSTESTRSTAAP
jgi:hypothetical protein